MRLENKSALITGAGNGIARAIAQAFARERAKVAIADIDLAAATQAADEIKSDGGIAIAVEMDVTNEQQVDKGIQLASDALEALDILVTGILCSKSAVGLMNVRTIINAGLTRGSLPYPLLFSLALLR